jgi:predicted signal transduction protein with EAL and GGDEF domain
VLAYALLTIETLLLVSLWGPQPIGWLWFGSHVDYWTGSVSAGIASAFLGLVITLFVTLAIAKRVDHAWRLVRRAAGHEQREGALNRIFVISVLIAGTAFAFWFFVIVGPGPTVAPSK